MTMKLATCCWLLVVLAGTTTLAQTPPKEKPVRKQAVMRKQVPQSVSREDIESYPLYPVCDLKTIAAVPLDSNKVYVYVEQMPTLNGQEVYQASIAAISQYLVVATAAPAGRVFVKFEVSKEGRVSHPQIVKGLRADLDSAVLVATRQLPRFTPGKQNGKVVTVSLTLPITIPVKKQP